MQDSNSNLVQLLTTFAASAHVIVFHTSLFFFPDSLLDGSYVALTVRADNDDAAYMDRGRHFRNAAAAAFRFLAMPLDDVNTFDYGTLLDRVDGKNFSTRASILA